MEFLEFLKDFQTIAATTIAAFIAWYYNRSKIKLDKENAKRDLFSQLNEKYDIINDYLVELVHLEFNTELDSQVRGERNLDMMWEELFESEPTQRPKVITSAFDYLNLCSEQYYWYKKGFIDENVWSCWKKGMQDWANDSFFLKNIIKREIERKASYYNSDFFEIFKKQLL